MSKSKNNEEMLVSKRSYKKLGTIIEHLTRNVNPLLYEIRITFAQNPNSAFITVFPLNIPINTIVYPVWSLVWTPYFNGKLVTHPGMLSMNADW